MAERERIVALQRWLETSVGLSGFDLQPASGDASFRRYFRVSVDGTSWIAMDAPPDREDCQPFVSIARQLAAIGLHVPGVEAQDLQQGFLLLEDLGSDHYLDLLDEQSADRLYGDALGALLVVQACGPNQGLPDYDRPMLLREMELFRQWLLERHLGLKLSANEHQELDRTFAFLADSALQQPRVCVLRDYHSRNLMLTSHPNPGILDFQDAVIGPVTYDLVSLLKDCYIDWPRERVLAWASGYLELALQSGVVRQEHEPLFLSWFDFMGVQRHLKAAGIFARLNHRDGKPGYLPDIPRTLGYVVDLGSIYPELAFLSRLCATAVVPKL